ncbi:MAG: Peptidoglycan glycosyltransferase [Clostridia bacterium]|jgi:stage V sporulation protein D (sporulation-specific penicillin-binding protein)|nr:Peptidoglycan glycosyltransferase [Clostridia bacterium]
MENKYKNKKTYFTLNKTRLNRRIFFIGMFFLTAIIYMGYQVTTIKLKKGEDYQKEVLSRMVGQEDEISPQRGNIVDRNNNTIAASVLTYDIILDPKVILGLEEATKIAIYQTLSKVINIPEATISKFVADNAKLRYSVISKNISSEKTEILKEKGLKGVWFEESFARKYPKGEFAAQLIGFFNKNGEGQYGIEQQYNDYILGKPGRVFSQLQDEQIVTTEVKAAENGAKVVLTIDEVIQQYVESAMKKYINEYKPINASAIIMNPNSGEIYSMYSYPNFNPNRYNVLEEQLGKEVWNALTDAEKSDKLNNAWKNFNIQSTYEPGSTFKPLLVAGALDESMIDKEAKYTCNGSKVVVEGLAPIRCWKREGHGEQTLEQVLANSCNVGMIDIGSHMDSAAFLKYMNRYGFGQLTDIELPGEEQGLLHQKLGPIEKATYSIGQGFTCTPLQLIMAFSSVINGGYLLKPYVVSGLVNDDNEMIYQNKTTVKRQVISAETSKTLAMYLKKVIDEGTGGNANITGYNIGGKTGTAQKQPREEEKYVLSFIGYAPINNPQVVGLVVFDEIPEHSGVPSKAFKDMMVNILPYLEIELANSEQMTDEKLSKVPNLINMDIYKASEELDRLALGYEVIGIGSKVTSQYPAEGITLPKDSEVKLYVQTEAPDRIMQVPNLLGLTIEDAKLLVGDTFAINGAGNGTIIKQVPKAGHKVEKNSPIVVKTSE